MNLSRETVAGLSSQFAAAALRLKFDLECFPRADARGYLLASIRDLRNVQLLKSRCGLLVRVVSS